MLRFRTFVVISALLSLLSSCEVDPLTIGNEWVNSNFRIVALDTLTVKLSTVYEDSIATANQNVLLVGRYDDKNDIFLNDSLLPGMSLTGITAAKSFMEFNLPSQTDIPDDAVFDSLMLEMRFNRSYFGDTTALQHMGVYKLAENIELGERGSYYNTTNFRMETSPITENPNGALFPNRPIDNSTGTDSRGYPVDPVRIQLSNSFGKELFRMIDEGNDTITNSDLFREYFKGLVLVPGSQSKAISGFRTDTTFRMRLYYHYAEMQQVDKYIDFTFNTSKQFNQVLADRTNTLLAPLNTNDDVLGSENTRDMAFVQAGAPVYAKIEFPTLNSLLGGNRHGAIERAVLYLKPAMFSYGDMSPSTPLPTEMNLYQSSLTGGDIAIMKDPTGSNIMNGNLFVDDFYLKDTQYSYDITSFLQQQLGVADDHKQHLLLRLPDAAMRGSVQRLILGNKNFEVDYNNRIWNYSQVKVIIYYTTFND